MINHIIKVIPTEKRGEGIRIVTLLTLSSLVDVFSLAAFYPLILMVINRSHIGQAGLLSKLYNAADIPDWKTFAILLTVIITLIILVKAVLSTWVTKKKAKYAYTVANIIAINEYQSFLARGYTRFTGIDVSKELNRLTNIPLNFATSMLIPAGTILSESVIFVFLTACLVLVDVKLVLLLALVMAPVSLVLVFQKSSLKKVKDALKESMPNLTKSVLQGLEAFVEIKTLQKEAAFKGKMNSAFRKMVDIFSSDHTRHVSISRITETVAGVLVGIIILYALLFYSSPGESLLLLSVYAGVIFRCLPSINKVISAYHQMKTYEFILPELSSMTSSDIPVTTQKQIATFHTTFHLKNVTFSYPSQNRPILDSLSVCIQKGSTILLSGKSGEGKTTLLLILLGLLKPDEGEILLDDNALNIETSRPSVAYVPQNPYLLDASIEENIAFEFYPGQIDKYRIDVLLKMLDLKIWVDSLPLGSKTVIGERGIKISGGQRQRLVIARALYHQADVFLFDEVTNQLDPETEAEVIKAIQQLSREHNKTIIFISHSRSTKMSFDREYQLREGSLVQLEPNMAEAN